MFRSTVTAVLAALFMPLAMAQEAPTPAPAASSLSPDQMAMRRHVEFLATDALRGRDTGSGEYDIAAQYVALRFREQGLRPAGDDGSYLQKVPLLSYKPAGPGSFVLSPRGRAPVTLAYGVDYLPGTDPSRAETSVSAPVVFVGWGLVAPQLKRDDYAGVDVRGKIVAYFPGAPRSFPGEERAHFGSAATKAEIASAHGAVGVLVLDVPEKARMSFDRMKEAADRPRVTWMEADGTGHVAAPGAPSLGILSASGSARLFAGARSRWDKIAARAAASDASVFKAEALPVQLTAVLRTATTPMASSNVAGLLPGSDPAVKDEVVVLTAHLDHVGVGKADARGDTIYNGAMDNAVGVASLIEEARRFRESGKPPRRSILFLAVTGEEKGLIGSDYFARHPTLPKANLVADVNLDMPILTYPFEDVIAFGADRSSLGPIVRKAAADMGLAFSPDPMPEMGLFVRSDHYRFVQQGIPSVFLWPGEKGPGKAAVEAFFANHYHQPSDQVDQSPPIDWESGVRFVQINYRIARGIADADERPSWNRGDFFGLLYGGRGAK